MEHALEIRFLDGSSTLPTLAYSESAAYDLSANLRNDADRPFTATIAPHTTRLIGTGLAMRPPLGHLILICSRSGLATKGIFVANAPGIVDPDYVGEIKVALFNGSLEPCYIRHGDRIAQALVVPFLSMPLRIVKEFPVTERGEAGFGSSGA